VDYGSPGPIRGAISLITRVTCEPRRHSESYSLQHHAGCPRVAFNSVRACRGRACRLLPQGVPARRAWMRARRFCTPRSGLRPRLCGAFDLVKGKCHAFRQQGDAMGRVADCKDLTEPLLDLRVAYSLCARVQRISPSLWPDASAIVVPVTGRKILASGHRYRKIVERPA
jgi:hypothetical protein